jgi:hypothetical protein
MNNKRKILDKNWKLIKHIAFEWNIWINKRKELKQFRMQNIQRMYNVLYMWTVRKRLSMGKFASIQGGLPKSSPLRSDGSWDSQVGDWTTWEVAKGTQNYGNSRGSIRLEPIQISWFSWWPGGRLNLKRPLTLKGELENNSRKPRDLTKMGIVTA